MLRSIALFGFASLAALGIPSPAEAILVAVGAGAGGIEPWLALISAWLGYSVGDAVSFTLLRMGVVRWVPARWRRKIDSTPLSRAGFKFVLASRLLPASSVANVVAASGPIRPRRFYMAATLGELAYVVGAIFLGLGGAALVRRSLPIALALAGLALAAALFVWQARARRRARAAVGTSGALGRGSAVNPRGLVPAEEPTPPVAQTD